MLISFFKYLKKHSYKILKSLAEFFAYPLFKYFKKAYLQNLEKSSTIFLLIPFFKYLKKHTYKILKNLAQFFCSYPFFKYLKYLRQFFKYLKKHTYKSQNTFFILIIILKETIYIKSIIQIIAIKTIISTK